MSGFVEMITLDPPAVTVPLFEAVQLLSVKSCTVSPLVTPLTRISGVRSFPGEVDGVERESDGYAGAIESCVMIALRHGDSSNARFRNFANTVAGAFVWPSGQFDFVAEYASQVPPAPQPEVFVMYISAAPVAARFSVTFEEFVYGTPPFIDNESAETGGTVVTASDEVAVPPCPHIRCKAVVRPPKVNELERTDTVQVPPAVRLFDPHPSEIISKSPEFPPLKTGSEHPVKSVAPGLEKVKT